MILTRGKIFLIVLYTWYGFTMADGNLKTFLNEVRSLSELPMDKLIQIKSSFVDDNFKPEIIGGSRRKSLSSLPVALSLKGIEKKPNRRYGDHYYEGKLKGSKISKIFQLAVTTLSFLAFGGYLLTLIITVIKRNATAASSGNFIVLSNLQNLQKYTRPKREAFIFDPMENDFDTDKLYRGMIMLSQGYASYN